MFHPTKHVLVIVWMRVQVVKSLYLVSMLEKVLALLSSMIFDNNKFLTLMLTKLSFEFKLFLGKTKGLANGHFLVYASQVEDLDKLLTSLVQNLVLVSNANHMRSSCL